MVRFSVFVSLLSLLGGASWAQDSPTSKCKLLATMHDKAVEPALMLNVVRNWEAVSTEDVSCISALSLPPGVVLAVVERLPAEAEKSQSPRTAALTECQLLARMEARNASSEKMMGIVQDWNTIRRDDIDCLTEHHVRKEVVVAAMAMYTELGVLAEDPPTLYPFNVRPSACPTRAQLPYHAECMLLVEILEYNRAKKDLSSLRLYSALTAALGALEQRPIARIEGPKGTIATVYETGPSDYTIERQRRLALAAMEAGDQKVQWADAITRSPAFRAYKEIHGYQTDELAFKFLLRDVEPLFKDIDEILRSREDRADDLYRQQLREDRETRREEREERTTCPGCY